MAERYLIVVGVDGSDGGRRALRWAVKEAARRQATVRAVCVWQPGMDAGDPQELKATRLSALRREIDKLTPQERSGVSISAEVVEGVPGRVLADAACEADLLVIGSHGHSRAWHQMMGSVAEECVRHAECPVVVVPTPRADRT